MCEHFLWCGAQQTTTSVGYAHAEDKMKYKFCLHPEPPTLFADTFRNYEHPLIVCRVECSSVCLYLCTMYSLFSDDLGKTWSKPVQLEPDTTLANAYSTVALTNYGMACSGGHCTCTGRMSSLCFEVESHGPFRLYSLCLDGMRKQSREIARH